MVVLIPGTTESTSARADGWRGAWRGPAMGVVGFGASGTLGEPNDPCRAVLGVQAVQHGEPVLDQSAHGLAPGGG